MPPDLSELSSAERRRLYELLSYEFREAPREKSSYSAEETLVWEALAQALPNPREYERALGSFVGRYGRAKYVEDVQRLRRFVTLACGEILRRPVRSAVLTICFRCLAINLIERALPVTPSTLLNALPFLEHAVDAQFPGYVRAKLLHRVARLRTA